MPRVIVIQQIYKSLRFVPRVYDAMMEQTYQDLEIIAQVTVDDEGAAAYIAEHYPKVKIVNPGYNIGFSRGHNELFATTTAEYYQLVNPDLVLTPDFIEKMVARADVHAKIGSLSGKLLRYDFVNDTPFKTIDSTGVIINKTGGARDRGQHQIDAGQFDSAPVNDATHGILGPCGAGAFYRKSALEAVSYKRPDGRTEYFDEDFGSYWEDVDLAWRLRNAGFESGYIPEAVAYHGRAAGSSAGGYKKVFAFIQHHKQIPAQVRQLNYRNHIYMFIKNTPHWYVKFFIREFFYNIYVLLFEPGTLKIVPSFFKGLSLMFKKRAAIKAQRSISLQDAEQLLH